MSIRRLYLAKLFMGVLLATALVWASQEKYAFYEKLLATCDSIISDAQSILPVKIGKEELQQTFDNIVQDSLVKVIVLSKHLDPLEIRYYSSRRLVAVDKLDESDKVLRRDVVDDSGNVRIQIFFGHDEKPLMRHYLNEDGDIVNARTFNLPYVVPGRIY